MVSSLQSCQSIDQQERWGNKKIIVRFIELNNVIFSVFALKNIQQSTFVKVKEGLIQFVENSCDKWCLNNLPTAVVVTGESILMRFVWCMMLMRVHIVFWCYECYRLSEIKIHFHCAGVNQGDHYHFFDTLSEEIRDDASVTVIQGRNSLTLKSAINTMVFGLIGQQIADNDVCVVWQIYR